MGTLGLVPTPQTSQTVQKALGAQTMACSASPSSDFLKHKFSILSPFMSKIALWFSSLQVKLTHTDKMLNEVERKPSFLQ